MTANDDTPLKGQESIERWRSGEEPRPLRDESDEDLAVALEEWNAEIEDAVHAATRPLLSDSVPLTDEKVVRVLEAAEALEALAGTLTLRVPDEHRADDRDE